MADVGFRRPFRELSPESEAPVQSPTYTSSPPPLQAKVLLDAYRGLFSTQNGSGRGLGVDPEFSSPTMLDHNDPVAMHLLVETAKTDSQTFDVLPFEEVEQLKNECTIVSGRVEATRRMLALESKVRDAALSLRRLTSKKNRFSGSSGSRSSLPSQRESEDGSNHKDDAYTASNRKCEELAQELWRLEKREMALQQRLLRHTAGVLQMTHGGPARKATAVPPAIQTNLPPGSPESMYTYTNGRVSMPTLDAAIDFDNRSFYHETDGFDDIDGDFALRSSLLASSRPESKLGKRGNDSSEISQAPEHVMAALSKLEDLNTRLREMIVQSRPEHESDYSPPPKHESEEVSRSGSELEPQLEYLERGIAALNTCQQQAVDAAEEREREITKTLDSWRDQLNMTAMQLSTESSQISTLPEISGVSLHERLHRFGEAINLMQEELQGFVEATRESVFASAGQQERTDEYENILGGLWELIGAGNDNLNLSLDSGLGHKRDGSKDAAADDFDSPEKFSLSAFSTRVQWLYSRAASLEEQKDILRRQIEQQRELGKKTDDKNDTERTKFQDEIKQLKIALENADSDVRDTRDELVAATKQLEEARRESSLMEKQAGMAEAEALQTERAARRQAEEEFLAELEQKREQISRMDLELHELRDDAEIARAEADATSRERADALEKLHAEHTFNIEEKESTIRQLQRDLETQTENSESRIRQLQEELDAKIQDNVVYIHQLESNLEARVDEIRQRETQAQHLRHELDVLAAAKSRAEDSEANLTAQVAETSQTLATTEAEMHRLEGEVVRLQTEVTVVKAELDGAYGTRAQRAAEGAANPALQREFDELVERNMSLLQEISELRVQKDTSTTNLRDRVGTLEKELAETLTEYEVLTKASISFEKERESLEALIDGFRDRCEDLEAQLSDEKVKWLGLKSPSGPAGASTPGSASPAVGSGPGLVESTSTSVLKTEFKKMMRATRAENAKLLRAEQEERRKLEALVRSLRRELPAGKSGLSQSMTVPS